MQDNFELSSGACKPCGQNTITQLSGKTKACQCDKVKFASFTRPSYPAVADCFGFQSFLTFSSTSGNCVCPAGKVLSGGSCIDCGLNTDGSSPTDNTQCKCKFGMVYDSETNTCACDSKSYQETLSKQCKPCGAGSVGSRNNQCVCRKVSLSVCKDCGI